jgi:NAD kinase
MASNELVIYSREHRLSPFKIYIDGIPIELKGDSITISTMSGSTGHNISVGGPILLSDNIVINCSGANRCNFRPIVLPIESKIRVETSACTGLADCRFSVNDDVFDIEAGDVYKVAVEDDYNPVKAISMAFLLN